MPTQYPDSVSQRKRIQSRCTARVRGANAVYTDIWASMGKESEAETRKNVFQPYQVNAALMKLAAPDALFMNCLPALRGYEQTAEVLDSPQSVVFDEAENRLHVHKAIMLRLLKENVRG